MSNELIWLIFLIVNFCLTLAAYKLYGEYGLYTWIAISVVLANIQVVKTVELFGFVATLGNIVYGGAFLATDILNENHGKESAKKGVFVGFFALISMVILMQFGLVFNPHESDIAHDALSTIFSLMPRIAAGSLIAYIISQMHDVWAFQLWKSVFKGKTLWLRNNLSTMVSQALDSVIFCFIAFWGIFETNIFISILITTFIFKGIVAILDTPFIYLSVLINDRKK